MKIALFLIVTLFLGYRNENVDLVISNAKIINTENGSIRLDHDIVAHRNNYGKSIRVIDASNLYAVPGLWDMHVHALWREWF